MTVPMVLTLGRLALAPVFFLFYQLAGHGSPVCIAAVCVVFLLIEISDLLDGFLARRLRQESELGKVLDPFADSLSRLSYFVAFVGSGILPVWILLILVYRDVSVAYIRVMISRDKVLLPARLSGKLKAWIYGLAGFGGVLVLVLAKTGISAEIQACVRQGAGWLFVLSAGVALWSMVDYAAFFMKKFRKTS
jgi:CDP-diacylglycerol--glycerol-3-phosphate 3-phosphatidyltransferase